MSVAADLIFERGGKTITVEEKNCPLYLKTEAKILTSYLDNGESYIFAPQARIFAFLSHQNSKISQFCILKKTNVGK